MAMLMMIKSVPDLMKQGIEIYDSLKKDMQRALGLRKFAEHLSHITQILKEVYKFLDEKEKDLAQKVDKAFSLSQKGLDKATVVVSVIRAQSSSLAQLLSESGPGTNQDKMWTACQYFSSFAKDIEAKVTEAEDSMREASNTLQSIENEIGNVVSTLKRVQDQFLAEKEAAEASQRALAYGGALVGLIMGPIGLIVTYSIAAGVVEGYTIPQIQKSFENQRKKVSEYIDGFQEMHKEIKRLGERMSAKRKKLIEIHGQLSATGSLAGVDNDAIRSMPLLHFTTIRKGAEELVKSCDEFLKSD